MNPPLLTTKHGHLVGPGKFALLTTRTHKFVLFFQNSATVSRMFGYKVALAVYEADPQSDPKFLSDDGEVVFTPSTPDRFNAIKAALESIQ